MRDSETALNLEEGKDITHTCHNNSHRNTSHVDVPFPLRRFLSIPQGREGGVEEVERGLWE